jgi:uncharacterized protein (TIGR03084 family)
VPDIIDVLADLDAESADIDALVTGLQPDMWSLATPAEGWSIAHQISHLAWTDHVALLSATDANLFLVALAPALSDPDGFVDRAATEGLAPGPELLARWRAGRSSLREALTSAPASSKLQWYGVAMSPVSMATGRIMETWAHGQDIADALDITRVPTRRLRHVVHLANRTIAFSFAAHGRPAPAAPIRLELIAPDGETWSYGPDDAINLVRGPALDFCLVATHRRHRDDVDLVATGPVADEWLTVAQTFAGPPGRARAPMQPVL